MLSKYFAVLGSCLDYSSALRIATTRRPESLVVSELIAWRCISEDELGFVI